jgi:hypothetical protein
LTQLSGQRPLSAKARNSSGNRHSERVVIADMSKLVIDNTSDFFAAECVK